MCTHTYKKNLFLLSLVSYDDDDDDDCGHLFFLKEKFLATKKNFNVKVEENGFFNFGM